MGQTADVLKMMFAVQAPYSACYKSSSPMQNGTKRLTDRHQPDEILAALISSIVGREDCCLLDLPVKYVRDLVP